MKPDIVIIILMAVAGALLLICTPLLIARIETLKEELENARLPVRCCMILKHPRGFESITPVLGVLNLQATPDQDVPNTTYISFDVMTPYQGENRRTTPMTTEPNNSAEQEPTVRMAAYDHLAKLHRKLEAENTRLKAELERANGLLALILKDAPIAECNDFHHAKPDRHEGFDCPVHKRWTAALAAACSHLNPKKTP